MGELFDNLGNKAAGYLVKATDWNALVQIGPPALPALQDPAADPAQAFWHQ